MEIYEASEAQRVRCESIMNQEAIDDDAIEFIVGKTHAIVRIQRGRGGPAGHIPRYWMVDREGNEEELKF